MEASGLAAASQILRQLSGVSVLDLRLLPHHITPFPHPHTSWLLRRLPLLLAQPRTLNPARNLSIVAALVAFMMLYGLTYEDIAYLRAKNKKGLYKTAADSPKHMNDYIESHNKIDIELWNLANARLDSTIEKLKREDAGACFERHLAVFAAVQAAVKAGCRDYQRFHAEHGLSNQTYSYVSDNGIGFR